MCRSSSIALNLAEGSGRATEGDQRRFYSIALGSLRECEAIIEPENLQDAELKERGDHLGRILYRLAHKNRTQFSLKAPISTQTETINSNGKRATDAPTNEKTPRV